MKVKAEAPRPNRPLSAVEATDPLQYVSALQRHRENQLAFVLDVRAQHLLEERSSQGMKNVTAVYVDTVCRIEHFRARDIGAFA